MKYKKIISLSLVILILLSSTVFAQGDIEKKETAYVTLDAQGKPVEEIVSVWLHSNKKIGKINDSSILKDIKNIKGEEVPEIKGDKVIWNSNQEDIFYQGKTNKGLPVDVKIKYSLDNKEINPKELAGKSGNIKMNIELINKEKHNINLNGENKEIYTPFMGMVVVNLPLDKFEDVKINSGKLISDGNNQVATFISIPGLKESLDIDSNILDLPSEFEISANVKDFELGPIMITATSEIPEIKDFEDAENIDELINGIETIQDASNKLADATGQIAEGEKIFFNNMMDLRNGTVKLDDSATMLKDGASVIHQGVDDAFKGSMKVKNGMYTLADKSKLLANGVLEYSNGAMEYATKAEEFAKGTESLSNELGEVSDKTGQLKDGADKIVSGTEALRIGQEQLTSGITESLNGIKETKLANQKELEYIESLCQGIDSLISTSTEPAVIEGLKTHKMGLEGLKKSKQEVISGLEEIEKGIVNIESGSKQLTSKVEGLNSGQKNLRDGIERLDNGISELGPISKKLSEGSKGLLEGGEKLTLNAKSLNEGANKFIYGSKELSSGTDQISEGLGELRDGTNTYLSKMTEFNQGMNEFRNGTEELTEGAKKLAKGTEELDTNMKKFNDEGIKTMNEEVTDKTGDLSEVFEIKDEIVKLSNNYQSFTGLGENMNGSVKFIMKTEEIKKEVEEKDIEVKKENENGFMENIIDKIKNLFN